MNVYSCLVPSLSEHLDGRVGLGALDVLRLAVAVAVGVLIVRVVHGAHGAVLHLLVGEGGLRVARIRDVSAQDATCKQSRTNLVDPDFEFYKKKVYL